MEVIDIMAIIGIVTAIVSLLESILNVANGLLTFIRELKGTKQKGIQKKKPSSSRARTRRRQHR
ncbi:hypothetical protein [Cytobacillus praedii]|uniref:Uncharacterized protein n=1 Tax=Cytobacillus praedii TaxID=1742358 RepID=A0A4R1AK56_9BACI|nr:hypothetical protein [Cytobacillus praedii]TCI99981.1 hypothetical protein E0Y62_27090 [Cytobacillus praedii]